MIHVAVGYHLP